MYPAQLERLALLDAWAAVRQARMNTPPSPGYGIARMADTPAVLDENPKRMLRRLGGEWCWWARFP
jgi:hypothetical protein